MLNYLMSSRSSIRITPARAALALAALAGALAGLLLAVQVAGGSNTTARSSAAPKTLELGKSNMRVKASCPKACEAVGRMTGYQALSNGRGGMYRAPFDGKLVAWSVKLGKPKAADARFFREFYGTPARARISVLRPGTKKRFRLTGHSPSVNLTPYFGQRPIFALDRPLTVRKGYHVALTVPTWAPAFAVGLNRNNAWRASRPSSRCREVKRRAAHQKRGSLRTYGCVYRTARLLYSATIVETKK